MPRPRATHALFVRPMLGRIFAHRGRVITRLLGAAQPRRGASFSGSEIGTNLVEWARLRD